MPVSLRHGPPQNPWRCGMISGTKMLTGYPLNPVSWEVRLPDSTSNRCWINLRFGKFGSQVNTSLLCSANHSEQRGRFYCPAERKSLPLGNIIGLKECTWSVFRLLVRIKVTSTWTTGSKVSQQNVVKSITLPLLAFHSASCCHFFSR